jgi:hypothetical protein
MDLERHSSEVGALRRSILETPGETARAQRDAVVASHHVSGVADPYLDKVRTASHRIVDDDIDRLRRDGLSEDAIFELTLAAALGEASRRFDAAIAALRRSESDRAP